MKLLLQSTRGVSLWVACNLDRVLVPAMIALALALAGAMFGYRVAE